MLSNENEIKSILSGLAGGCKSRADNVNFNTIVLPFFNMVITGAFSSLSVYPSTVGKSFYLDLKQDMYMFLLDKLTAKRLNTIKDLEAYAFFIIKSRTLNALRNNKKRKDYRAKAVAFTETYFFRVEASDGYKDSNSIYFE